MANTSFRTFEKKILRGLLADDKLEQLQAQLRDITTADDHKDLANEVVLNAGRLSDYRRMVTTGTALGDELRVTRNQIRLSFLNIIDALPDEITVGGDPSVKMPKLMTEQRFKSWVFGCVLGGKLFLIIAAIILGGFTWVELLSIIFMSLPTLMMCLGVMLADILRRRNDLFPSGNDRKTVSTFMTRTTFTILILYLLFFFILIDAYARGNIADNEANADFKSLISWLGILECVFALYIGQIVYGLFREK